VSYVVEESSAESGRPIELFQITLGSDVFRYTSAAEDITADGNDWNAIPIFRGEIELGSDARGNPLTVTVGGDNQFAQNFVENAPPHMPEIEIFSVHFGDISDVSKIWEGEITEIVWVDDAAFAQIIARPPEAGLDSRTPRRDSGALCPYMLFDTQCTVSEASHKYDGIAGSVSGNTLTVSGLDAAKLVGWATAGKIVFGNDYRVIVAHTATDTLELGSPLNEDPTGETVSVYAGCDHTLATCNSKFSNAANFGGRPYVPGRDINESGIS